VELLRGFNAGEEGKMIRRGTLVVVAIFVLLIGLSWYLEWSPAGKARVRGTPTATAYPRIISLGSGELMKLELKTSSGTFGIKRNLNDTWSFADNENTPTDQGKIQQLLATLTGLQSKATVDTKTLDAFGLVSANQILTIQTTNGTSVLKIGKITPTSSGYYVQVDNQSPVVVDKYSIEQILNTMNRQALSAATATPLPVLVTPGSDTSTPTP
jgi:hypothetical protein